MVFKEWYPREATAAQKKLEQAIAAKTLTHTYSLHKMTQTDNLEATEATYYQGEKKATQVNKKRRQFELETIDKTKMIQFILRCQKTAPLCVNWYWHSETLRLDAPAKKHVRKKKSMQTNKTN